VIPKKGGRFLAKAYKVLHMIGGLGPYGTEHQLVRNIGALDRSHFVSYVYYLHPFHDLLGELEAFEVQASCLNLGGKISWAPAIYGLSKRMKSEKFDIVHTNLFEADLIGGIAAKIAGIPVVSTLASPADSSVRFSNDLHLNRFKVNASIRLQQMVFRTCHTHFVAVSEHTKESWIHDAGLVRSRITVIPRAVQENMTITESADSARSARSAFSLNGNYPVLVNVGRLIPHKGQKFLLQAMPEVLKAFPKSRLLIAGEGALRSELEQLTRELGIQSSVTFLGTYSGIKELLLSADYFVFPSLSEGMPGALLEAAAVGKPVVASNIGPVREVIKDGESGLLVTPGSSQELAEGILRFCTNREEAESLGNKARETILRDFLIGNTVRKLENMYVEIIEGRVKSG
jgi:L-malate glycosyltransferase